MSCVCQALRHDRYHRKSPHKNKRCTVYPAVQESVGLASIGKVGAVSGVVAQERQLLPEETHQPGPEQLHSGAPSVGDDDPRR